MICLFVSPFIYTEAHANNPTDYTYSVKDDEVTITKYTGDAKDIRIPETIEGMPVTKIGDRAFENKNLTSVEFPDSVTFIGFRAFFNNELTEIKLSKELKSIKSSSFAYNQLSKVTLPNKLEYIHSEAFYNNQIKTIKFPSTIKSIASAAFQKNNLTKLVLPKSIKKIYRSSFADNQLTSLTIPSSVTLIQNGAFSNNELTHLTIPKTLHKILEKAFSNNQLQSVNVLGTETIILNNVFSLNPSTLTIRQEMNSTYNYCRLEYPKYCVDIADYYPKIKISQVTDSSTRVKGTVDPNETVYLYKGNTLLSVVNAAANGSYSFAIDKQPAGTVLKVKVKNAHDLTKIQPITVIDKTPPPLFVKPVTDYASKVSGTTEARAKVIVTIGETTYKQVRASSKGNFSVKISTQDPGTKVIISSTDKMGNTKSVTKTVIDKTPPFISILNGITSNSTAVTGIVESGATVTVYNSENVKLGSAISKNGKFSVKIKKQKAYTYLTVSATDKAKNVGRKNKLRVNK